jgi:hypothetical protein
MNAHELYRHMLKAAYAFGLPFYDLEYIEVKVKEDCIVFTHGKQEFTVNLKG